MDIFSNPNFNILPLTVDLGIKDESRFVYSKNGLSFVIKKRFMSDIENRDDYRCCLLKIEILEGDVADVNPFVAPPIMVYSVSKNEYYTFTLSNIHQSTENVVLTFNFSFNYKEQRIVSEMVYITVPVAKTKMLKFGEYICDTICFPQYNKLTFESYWTKNMLNNGKAVCRFIVKNKKGVIINGFKTDFYINFEECYLDNYFFQPYEINFTIDLDEVQKKLQMPKLPNFSNPKKLDGHSFNNPHLPKPKLCCQNSISKQIPSNSSLLGQQNLQNNSSQKTTSTSSTPLLLKLFQAPPQKKLTKTSFSFEKNKYKSLKSIANKERTENEIENITCLQESLMKINSSDSLSVSSKTIDTFKDLESPIDSEHFKENVYGASKAEDLLKKLYLISSSDNLCDADFSEPSTPPIFNVPFDEATVEMLQQDTLSDDLSISKTFEIQNLLHNSVGCTKYGPQEVITEKNDIQLNPQKYCTGSDVESQINEVSKTILSTLKHIEPKYLEKEYVFQAEEITTKQFSEIPFVDSNDEDSKTLIKFITSDGIEIEENAEILCNVSPIFKAVFDSSDKNDCKIDTKFNSETVHHALNYLRENDEKFIKDHEKELYKFASEYVIKSLKFLRGSAATDSLVPENCERKEKVQSYKKPFETSTFTILNENSDDIKKRWKKENSINTTNKSILSLHITAYEKSIEAVSSDLFGDKNVVKKEKFESIKTSKQCFTDTLKSRNPFEFSRQQSGDQKNEPEVMQFKASQQLFDSKRSALSQQSGHNKKEFLRPQMALGAAMLGGKAVHTGWPRLLRFGLSVMLPKTFRGSIQHFSTTPISRGQYKYESSYKPGAFYPEFPDNTKPTHIIIGAGSAGCVLANRLTENPDNHVLLIEAGPKDHWWNWKIHMPAALMYNLCNDTYNWFYHTTAQKNLNDRVIYWPRGRVWGGSSSLNAMAYVRGHPYDYDRWEKEGAIGWSYKNCLPYFKKAQNHNLSTGPDDKYRGHDGPLHVSQGKCDSLLHKAFMDAGKTHPIGYTEDMNGYRQEGLGPMDMTIREGIRWSASRAYLHPILDRKNLYTSSGIYCTKILFDKNKAIGIEFLRQMNVPGTQNVDSFSREKIYCQGNIILAGGAINTPQLLMLSGVGPASNLKAHEIPLVQEMSGVGNNLQDHLEIYIQERCSQPITLYNQSSWRFPHNMIRIGLQWFFNRTGLAASSHLESGGFARSRPDVEHPDIQFHFLPSTVHDDGRTAGTCHAYQVHVGPMRSKSSGTIRLASKDPRRHPLLDPNYMAHEEDWIEFRKCIELSREIFREPSFDKFRDGEIGPGEECKTKEQVDEFVRQKAASAYHPSCTCKMGLSSDSNAVVDGETMKVHGLENLMIADASVMPSIVSGNLNAPTIMIAERAADIIDGKKVLPPESPPIWKPDSNSPTY